jgi:PAS domain S-box-containing protein
MAGRPFSEICRELAHSAELKGQKVLTSLLRMAALDAAETGVRHEVFTVRDMLVGAWDWDIVNDRLYADARFAAMFGISPDDAASGTPQKRWVHAIHPDDRPMVEAAIINALKGSLYSIEYRVATNGQVRWLYARGKCTMNAEGRAERFPGAIVDITHEKLEELQPSIAPV